MKETEKETRITNLLSMIYNLEKDPYEAENRLNFLCNENNRKKARELLAYSDEEIYDGLTKRFESAEYMNEGDLDWGKPGFLTNGVYYYYGNDKVVRFNPMDCPEPGVQYIGIVHGNYGILLSLHNFIAEDSKYGRVKLLDNLDKCPDVSEDYYSLYRSRGYDQEGICMSFTFFEGKDLTDVLIKYGFSKPLKDGEFIPNLYQWFLISFYQNDVDKALEKVNGDSIRSWYWSSNQFSKELSYIVSIPDCDFGPAIYTRSKVEPSARLRTVKEWFEC